MTTTTATPTVETLQAQVAKLEEQLDNVLEEEKDGQKASERVADQLRQIAVEHHDQQRHRGSQRFCTEAPCPALNDLLDSGDL